jgi:hypothetical protein
MKWVPKSPPSILIMQKISQQDGQIGQVKKESSRRMVPKPPMVEISVKEAKSTQLKLLTCVMWNL